MFAFLTDNQPTFKGHPANLREQKGREMKRAIFAALNTGVLIVCSVIFSGAQVTATKSDGNAKDGIPPEYLRPSDHAVQRANEMDGEVFKIYSVDWGYVRGSSFGAYYSFKNQDYSSYQFSFATGELKVGGGLSYGFYTDLGVRDFREIDKTSPEAAYFLSYRPPNLEPDIRRDIERLKNENIDGVSLSRQIGIKVGHTYLLRSIDFRFADTAVVLQIVESSTDDSLTIVWKKLAEFERPRILLISDDELRRKVSRVLADLAISDLTFTVKNNYVTFEGPRMNFDRVKTALNERQIPYCGIAYGTQPKAHITLC
ncbi:MAG: hypothetical protein AB7J13_14060 [Pyrinomonadaceae bacterium]